MLCRQSIRVQEEDESLFTGKVQEPQTHGQVWSLGQSEDMISGLGLRVFRTLFFLLFSFFFFET